MRETATRLYISFISLFLLLASPFTLADDLSDGNAFYRKGRYERAIPEYRKVALEGNATAQTDLGILYPKALGTKKDYAQAQKWFQKAAEQGEKEAQYRLGSCMNKAWV